MKFLKRESKNKRMKKDRESSVIIRSTWSLSFDKLSKRKSKFPRNGWWKEMRDDRNSVSLRY